MNKAFVSRNIYFLLLVIIIAFSFFNHSSLYSPFLNSDDAVVVLMIHDFSIPQDLYYWDANRFGSLVPLVGQFFHKVLPFTPIQSESITHYLLHILGFLGFASLFKSNTIKLIFALVWFLPPLRMIDVLKLSQGEQYALMGMAVGLMNKMYSAPKKMHRLKAHILLLSTTLVFIASVWVSDLAVVSIAIILFLFGFRFLKKMKPTEYISIIKKRETFYIAFGFIAGSLFIYYAKTNAVWIENFYSFFDLNSSFEASKIFLRTINEILTFKARETFTSLYTYLLIGAISIGVINYRKISISGISSKWLTIFILDLVLVFTVIIVAKWSFLNGVPRRYFVCNYVSFWMAFLLCLEHIQNMKFKWLLNSFVVAAVLVGGLGTLYNFKYISPKSLKPTIYTAAEFGTLGEIGVISEYWNSYINSVPNPDKVKTTPHDKNLVRKQSLVDSVFAQPQIYINRDMWMDSFPDTFEQFGYCLVKDGEEFYIAGSHVCKYQKIKLEKTFHIHDLKYLNSNASEGAQTLLYSSSCQSCLEKHIVFGPYINLGIGKFKVRFYLKVGESENPKKIALLDVATDAGWNQLVSREISQSDFSSLENYQYIDIDFETNRRYSNVEFRIWYYGNADLHFDHITILEH